MDTNKQYLTSRNQKLRKENKAIPISRGTTGNVFKLNFPVRPDPKLAQAYSDRKVSLISRKRFINIATQKPEDLFVGSLRVG